MEKGERRVPGFRALSPIYHPVRFAAAPTIQEGSFSGMGKGELRHCGVGLIYHPDRFAATPPIQERSFGGGGCVCCVDGII